MAISKVKLPDNTTQDIKDSRIQGVDSTPTANSQNVVTSGGAYSGIHPTVVTTQPAGGFVPNVLYRLGTLTGSVTFTLASPSDSAIENEYHWSFTAGNPAPTITWPTGVEWVGGEPPTINAGQKYEISILDGVGGNVLEPASSGGGSYTLPIASASGLGGIKVGSGLSIDSTTGVLSTTGGGTDPDAVHFTSQTLTDAQKTQARTNIGAGTEDTSNKVTALSAQSTDTQYPSAKCVYDLIGDVETLLEAL